MSREKKKPDVVTAAELQTRKKGEPPAMQRGSTRLYTGKIISLDRDIVEFPDGRRVPFDIARHSGASAVLPFLGDPKGDAPQVLLIRQFRYASGGYLYEIPAGRLDGDESPAMCAARELKEETGCTAGHIEPLTSILTTPGFTDEVIHLFMATDITHGEPNREADEFVDLIVMHLAEALEKIRTGEITDSKTALALLYAAGFKT